MSTVALITGGTRGIGLEIAVCLGEIGYSLALNGVRPQTDEGVQQVLKTLRKAGQEVSYHSGDIGSRKDRKRMMAEVRSLYGRLDLLVNNAGVAPKERKDLLDTTEESYDWVMDINLKGPHFLTQAVANWMIEQGRGAADYQGMIVNISSISATVASVNRGEYCLSKAGMGMMTQLWATRLAEFDIPVYEIRPGIIETDMTSGVKAKYDKLISEGLTLQPRWGKPRDVGLAVQALAERKFPYSTGQVLMVDGGLTMERL